MNILAINPFKISNNNNTAVKTPEAGPYFGLKMAEPLTKDTVTFGCLKQSTKKMASKKDKITNALAKQIRARKAKPHERKKQLLLENFNGLIENGFITFDERLKKEYSIREKSATRGWSTMEQCLNHMNDISGFSFTLNTPKAFPEVIKQLKKMLKTREIEVVEAEYHRRAPVYKKGVIDKTFDSLKPSDLQTLKSEIYKIQNPTTQIWKDVDSMSGYSGLHLTLRTKDGEKSELQIMTSSMAKVKKVENILYKERNGKTIDPKYDPVESFLAPLKPLDEYASDSEKKAHEALQSAMTKYIQEAYYMPLEKPYDPNFTILKVNETETLTKKEKALVEKYGLDKIFILMEACEKIAQQAM